MLKSHTPQQVLEKPDAGGGIGTAAPTITEIAAEIGKRNAQLAAFTGPHPDEERLAREVNDLMDTLSWQRPRNDREALAVAAVAIGVLHDLDGLGDYLHELAMRLIANLIDYQETATGTTAAALGVGIYAERRHDGPMWTVEDSDESFIEMTNRAFAAGYAAARAGRPFRKIGWRGRTQPRRPRVLDSRVGAKMRAALADGA
jgi:hypothetical protein